MTTPTQSIGPAMLEQIRHKVASDKQYNQNYANDGQRFVASYLRGVLLLTQNEARQAITDGADAVAHWSFNERIAPQAGLPRRRPRQHRRGARHAAARGSALVVLNTDFIVSNA